MKAGIPPRSRLTTAMSRARRNWTFNVHRLCHCVRSKRYNPACEYRSLDALTLDRRNPVRVRLVQISCVRRIMRFLSDSGMSVFPHFWAKCWCDSSILDSKSLVYYWCVFRNQYSMIHSSASHLAFNSFDFSEDVAFGVVEDLLRPMHRSQQVELLVQVQIK